MSKNPFTTTLAAGVVALLGLAIFTGSAAADCPTNTTSCTGLVKLLYVNSASNSSGIAYVDPDGSTAPHGCLPAGGAPQFIQFELSSSAGRAIYQVLLAAQLAGKTVKIRYNADQAQPATVPCTISYVTLDKDG